MNDAHTADAELDEGEMGWDAFDALTDKDVRAGVALDPDAEPLTEAQLRAGTRAPDVRAIRTRLGLSQCGFASRFGFSARTVQEWEQSRSVPNRGYRLYLHAIADPTSFLKLVSFAPDADAERRQHASDGTRSTAG